MKHLRMLVVGFWGAVTGLFCVCLIGVPLYELFHTSYGKGDALGQLFASGLITLIGLFVLYMIGRGIIELTDLQK